MSDFESSRFGGKPLQLYEFHRVSGGVDYYWRYNTSDRDIKYAEEFYKATAISDGGVKLSGDADSTGFEVTMPIAEEFCASFRMSGTLPSDTVALTVRRVHAGDIAGVDGDAPTVVGVAPVVWVGTVDGLSQTDEITAKLTCSMLTATLKRGGLRYGYQSTCPHVLYGSNGCKVDKELFRVSGPVVALTHVTVEVAAFASHPNGWWDGGFLEYNLATGPIERRMILNHAGPVVRILGYPAGLVVGRMAAAYPGCNRTSDHCINKFNNLLNMGAFLQMPGRNPFDGQPVF